MCLWSSQVHMFGIWIQLLHWPGAQSEDREKKETRKTKQDKTKKTRLGQQGLNHLNPSSYPKFTYVSQMSSQQLGKAVSNLCSLQWPESLVKKRCALMLISKPFPCHLPVPVCFLVHLPHQVFLSPFPQHTCPGCCSMACFW